MQLGRTILIALAFSAVALAADQSAAEKELLKIENEWFQAYFHSDAATMNRIEGEDCVVITGSTNVKNELEPRQKNRNFSSRSEATKTRLASMKRSLEHTQVRFMGDIAIVNGLNVETGQDASGVTHTGKAYYTSVWVKRNSTWQIVNVQLTDAPKP